MPAQTIRPVVLHLENDENDAALFALAATKKAVCFSVHRVDTCRAARDFLLGRNEFEDREMYPIPCLGVIDHSLNGETGLDLIRWARNEPAIANIPFLMLSGSSGRNNVSDSYAAGAISFLTKPTGLGGFYSMVEFISRCIETRDFSTLNLLKEYRPAPESKPVGRDPVRAKARDDR